MGTGEMISMGIVLQEQRFKVSQMVILPEESPNAVGHFQSAIVPLVILHLCKFIYQRLVYHEMLPSVGSW